jgi:hypothetical protein
MSTDSLGNLFDRLRQTVDDSDAEEPEAPAAATTSEPPRGDEGDEGDDGHEAEVSAPDPRAEVPESEALVVEVVDAFALGAVEPEPKWPMWGVAESVSLDDVGLRRRRDAALETAMAVLLPRVKRRLQDEQNELLDALRRQKSKIDVERAIEPEADQLRAWAELLAPVLDDAYAAGRTLGGGRTRPAPARLVERTSELLVLPLRERVLASLEAVVRDGPYDGAPEWQRVISAAVGARYREWRSQDLEPLLGDLVVVAFARGVYDATPDGMRLRWVPAEVEQCPDADDNALEPTMKGGPFPTGQACPPAHPGCRCLVVPEPVTT